MDRKTANRPANHPANQPTTDRAFISLALSQMINCPQLNGYENKTICVFDGRHCEPSRGSKRNKEQLEIPTESQKKRKGNGKQNN